MAPIRLWVGIGRRIIIDERDAQLHMTLKGMVNQVDTGTFIWLWWIRCSQRRSGPVYWRGVRYSMPSFEIQSIKSDQKKGQVQLPGGWWGSLPACPLSSVLPIPHPTLYCTSMLTSCTSCTYLPTYLLTLGAPPSITVISVPSIRLPDLKHQGKGYIKSRKSSSSCRNFVPPAATSNQHLISPVSVFPSSATKNAFEKPAFLLRRRSRGQVRMQWVYRPHIISISLAAIGRIKESRSAVRYLSQLSTVRRCSHVRYSMLLVPAFRNLSVRAAPRMPTARSPRVV